MCLFAAAGKALLFHFASYPTLLKIKSGYSHPLSCLCHRPISLIYNEYEQNSEVSNRVV